MKSYTKKVQTLNEAYSEMKIAFLDYAAKKSTSKKYVLTILKIMEEVYTKKKAQYYLENHITKINGSIKNILKGTIK